LLVHEASEAKGGTPSLTSTVDPCGRDDLRGVHRLSLMGRIYPLKTARTDKEGNVAFSEATACAHPTFGNSSLKAIRKWKFEPARFEGKPVNMRCRIIVPYIFHE